MKTVHNKSEIGARDWDGGFSLIELLVAMAIGLLILGAMYGVFNLHGKAFGIQEQIAEMQQTARVAMDIMTREIRMAGYDPPARHRRGWSPPHPTLSPLLSIQPMTRRDGVSRRGHGRFQ